MQEYKFFILTADAVRAVKRITDDFVEWDYLTASREGKVRHEEYLKWLEQNEAELTMHLWEAEAQTTLVMAQQRALT